MTDHLHEASTLINHFIDGLITNEEQDRLAALMQQDEDVIDLYVRLTQVHGQLTWGAACESATSASADDLTSSVQPRPQPATGSLRPTPRRISRRRLLATAVGLATAIILMLVVAIPDRRQPGEPDTLNVGTDGMATPPEKPSEEAQVAADTPVASTDLLPLRFDSLHPRESVPLPDNTDIDLTGPAASDTRTAELSDLSDEAVIAAIDRAIDRVLIENDVTASPKASADEWTRRVWLTLAGRIPSLDEMPHASRPLTDDDRATLVDQLLAGPDRSRRLAEVWTRLLVGRAERPQIDRGALHEFLLTAFSDNRPWIDVVGELVSAEGRSDENGATNFLLAHLDNQATPATAVTARLFLGEQLQCMQCHDHPFSSQLQQREYWAFNAFFQNAERIRAEPSAAAAAMDGRPLLLTDQPNGGMTFFETLNGRQQAVEPEYDGTKIPANDDVSRRVVLAGLLADDSRSRVARSMVNRTWADFFGYGFTNPVDDMGIHATVSHPELLETLTKAFVASGYDLRRLQRWIALSDAWQRTSQSVAGNETDAPESGSVPLFSRVYPRRMTPEQVYDSIRVAIRGVAGEGLPDNSDADHRRAWVSQFVRPYNTDENDEADEFNGSVAQAMVMMNGTDINAAIRQAGTAFLSTGGQTPSAEDVLQQVAQAVLTRAPTEQESAVFRKHLRLRRRSEGSRDALPQVTEDMLWAYLNSSEFLLIH